MKQIMQKLGEKWKALGQEAQSKYRQQNQEHMAKYHLDVVEFYDDHPEAVPPPRTAKLLERLRWVWVCVRMWVGVCRCGCGCQCVGVGVCRWVGG